MHHQKLSQVYTGDFSNNQPTRTGVGLAVAYSMNVSDLSKSSEGTTLPNGTAFDATFAILWLVPVCPMEKL